MTVSGAESGGGPLARTVSGGSRGDHRSQVTPAAFLGALTERVLVFDGAMGSNLLALGLNADDYSGAEGCSEALLLRRADAIRTIHANFLRAGARAIETNTFGATRATLAEYGLGERVAELNRLAVQTAREALEEVPGDGSPRFIAGSIGPTTRLPSLGQIGYAAMRDGYLEQLEALIAAGIDLVLIETCQDLLQTKAALSAVRRVFAREHVRLPVMVSLTLEATGTMLVGSDIGAITAILSPYDLIDVIGINCATGPAEMVRHLEHLAAHCPKPIACQPNAGLPEIVGGRAVYRLTPSELAGFHRRFVTDLGVAIVGGCCGTTPEHLRAVADEVGRLRPRPRAPQLPAGAASLYHAVPFRQEPAPALVGERTNANGSRQFRELLLADDWDGMVALGREQARGGAHLIDLCCAFVGRSEIDDMTRLVPAFARQVKLPLMIDSTEPEVIERALMLHGGRCVINSVNLEDGGDRLRRVAVLAREFGAAVIGLTIDERGMARTAPAKLEVARRLYQMLVGDCGLAASDLIFDPLTFTVGSGDATLRDAAIETIAGLRLIKQEYPQCQTLLGVSNISFGLAPDARQVLNSVFLARAVAAGLDLAIVNPAGIVPIFRIDPATRALAEALLDNRPADGSALAAFMAGFAGGGPTRQREPAREPAARLREKVIDGEAAGLADLLATLRADRAPLAIINELLIPAMKEVGDLFGAGQMQLPFVLQSAETMKAAVDLLAPFMAKAETDPARKIVLATVRGDVHDIGKNLVEIMLANNGFSVINLGIKVDIDEIVREAQRHGTDIIGLSGLLVKSTLVMKEYLQELDRRGLRYRVLLGGAALTRSFVENDLAPSYGGTVFYCPDAFAGLQVMRQLTGADRTGPEPFPPRAGASPGGGIGPDARGGRGPVTSDGGGGAAAVTAPHTASAVPPSGSEGGRVTTATAGDGEGARGAAPPDLTDRSVAPAPDLPTPPFYGAVTCRFEVAQVLPFIDRPYLTRVQWGYRRGALPEADYQRLLREEVEPTLERWLAVARDRAGLFDLRARYGYWRCRRQGNALVLFSADSGCPGDETARFVFPRRRSPPHWCLADFFEDGTDDVVALFVVTAGAAASRETHELFSRGRYREYLHLHGLSVMMAEAGAEALEALIRRELGLIAGRPDTRGGADSAAPSADAATQGSRVRGRRYAFGYPVAPDLAAQADLLRLVGADQIGVSMTQTQVLVPEQSTAGLVVHHPDATWFTLD